MHGPYAPSAASSAGPGPRDTTRRIRRISSSPVRRPPGSAIGDIPPEVALNQGDIRSYGVSSVADLLSELAPQTRSGQGRGGEAPVVLLNGHRISGLREIQDIPTEAIQRVEILPEEVGLSYGYTADQKVVNIVLRRFFRATTAEASAGTSTEGGGSSAAGRSGHASHPPRHATQLDVKYQAGDSLLESSAISSRPAAPPFRLRRQCQRRVRRAGRRDRSGAERARRRAGDDRRRAARRADPRRIRGRMRTAQ